MIAYSRTSRSPSQQETCRGLQPVRHKNSCSTNNTVDGRSLKPIGARSLDNVAGRGKNKEHPQFCQGHRMPDVSNASEQCYKENLQRRGRTSQETMVQEVKGGIEATWPFQGRV